MRQGVQFAVSMVLARILAPEDFGVVAMLALFVGVAGIFIDSGLSAALIQRQNTTHTDESTVFFFNMGMGALMAMLLCLLAPWIATFFQQSILVYLTYAMAFNVFLNAFGSIHVTLLTKEMNFRTIAKVGGIASLLSGAFAVLLAAQNFGVWSLVGQVMVSSIITVFLLWIWHPWRPSWTFNTTSLRSFFRFGGYEMAANLLDVFSTNLNLILIGKFFTVRDVGFYDRAQRTQQLPVTVMMGVINRVAFSVFSSVAEDKARLVRGVRKAQINAMIVNLPILISVIILAEPLILTLFGDQWLPTVPILQVLAVAGLIWPLHVMNLTVLKAQGRTDLFFWITILKKVVTIGLAVVASFYGIMAIAWAMVGSSLFAYFVNAHYSKIFLGYGALKQLRDLLPIILAVIPMALVTYSLLGVVHASPPIKLVAISAIGCLAYILTCLLVCKETMNEFLAAAGIMNRQGQE
jgi:O-antigen/teichoic acid export membrane protein